MVTHKLLLLRHRDAAGFFVLLWSVLLISLFGSRARADDLDQWLGAEQDVATKKLLANLLDNGAVIASPSKNNPDYYYHWVRDGALTMDVVVSLYRDAAPADRDRYLSLLTRYMDFSLALQVTNNLSTAMGRGLGEPKFNTDGSAYMQNWGRPQDDSPALRAASLCRLANLLLDGGQPDMVSLVKGKLYDGVLPTNSLIKRDLEYVSHNWDKPCVDLWEECSGHHFYTRMVQRRALHDGARLATRLGDGGAATWYSAQAVSLENVIRGHWDPTRGILVATLDQQGPTDDQGQSYKSSGLDMAVVLGVLHANSPGDDFFGPTNDQVLATAQALSAKFAAHGMYAVNGTTSDAQGAPLGPALGRYPEDRYYGGNPWYLCTAAMAELYYRAANSWQAAGSLTVSGANKSFLMTLDAAKFSALQAGHTLSRNDQAFIDVLAALRGAGDAELRRVKYHAVADGALSEQYDRNNGFATSAVDLTWSYDSILTAAWQRRGTSAPRMAATRQRVTSAPFFAQPLNRAGVPLPVPTGSR